MRIAKTLATVAALLAATSAQAQTEPETIGLHQLIQLALQRDFQIRIADLDAQAAEQYARAANGYWDPAIRAQYSEGALGGGGGAASSFNSQDGELFTGAIDANLPTGARLTLDAAAAKFENSSSDTFAANAGIAITQPLLQDFGGRSSRARIKIAQRNRDQSRHAFQQAAISTVTRAITLYNQVALSKATLQVAEQSQELARQLVADTRTRARLGTVEARGVEVAETRLSQREARVVTQRRIYLDALNELKRLVSNEALPLVRWQVQVAEMPAPEDFSSDLEADFAYALQHRPDYRQALIDIEKAQIEAQAAGSEALPQLDLTARYFRTDFGSSYRNSIDGLADAPDDLFIGVTFRRPILNATPAANRAAALIRRDQSELVEQQLQQAIAIQLDNASRRIHTEAQNRQLARQGREFAVRSLEAEERKLKLGETTTFFVLASQEDLAEAQIRELESIANYNIALAQYQQLKGATLPTNAIDL